MHTPDLTAIFDESMIKDTSVTTKSPPNKRIKRSLSFSAHGKQISESLQTDDLFRESFEEHKNVCLRKQEEMSQALSVTVESTLVADQSELATCQDGSVINLVSVDEPEEQEALGNENDWLASELMLPVRCRDGLLEKSFMQKEKLNISTFYKHQSVTKINQNDNERRYEIKITQDWNAIAEEIIQMMEPNFELVAKHIQTDDKVELGVHLQEVCCDDGFECDEILDSLMEIEKSFDEPEQNIICSTPKRYKRQHESIIECLRDNSQLAPSMIGDETELTIKIEIPETEIYDDDETMAESEDEVVAENIENAREALRCSTKIDEIVPNSVTQDEIVPNSDDVEIQHRHIEENLQKIFQPSSKNGSQDVNQEGNKRASQECSQRSSQVANQNQKESEAIKCGQEPTEDEDHLQYLHLLDEPSMIFNQEPQSEQDFLGFTEQQQSCLENFDPKIIADIKSHRPTDNLPDDRHSEILKKIEETFHSLILSLTNDQPMTLKVPNVKKWEDCVLSNDILSQKEATTPTKLISYNNKASQRPFTIIVSVMCDIYKRLARNLTCTKREIYYRDVDLFGNQETVNKAIDSLCAMFEVQEHELGVLSSSKGLVAGDLIIVTSNERIDCTTACLVPQNPSAIVSLESKADYVLIVEKDTVFQRLINENIFTNINKKIILITAKGYPDVNTRILLKRIETELKKPIYIIVDADPHGVEIMFTYKYGSMLKIHNSQHLAVPSIEWIGQVT